VTTTSTKPTNGQRLWRGWIRPLAIMLLALGSLRSAVADWNDVPSGSMKPTILIGDRIFVNKLAYDLKVPFTTWRLTRWGAPQRGDVVVFFSPEDGQRLVKRVIGVPGDRIEMRANRLLINGDPAEYHEATGLAGDEMDMYESMRFQIMSESVGEMTHPVMTTLGVSALGRFEPLVVPAGSYFMMGDNRDNSRDSRVFGFVDGDRIIGKATAVVLSFDHDAYYLPRWGRFFTSMP
jgi:signal peptidase I